MDAPVKTREGFQREEQPQPRKPAREAVPPPEPVAAPEPAADAEQAPAYVETWPIKVKLLHRKILGNKNETLDELSFREPTGGDVNRVGNPVRINSDGDVIIDEIKMTRMMGALSGILTPLLDRLDPRDWNSCAYRLRRFFLPDPEAW